MASPFAVFRKNRKLMYAILTLLAMVSFVILPYILDTMSTRRVQDPVVAKTKYGGLRASDLQHLLQERRRILNALVDMTQAANLPGLPPGYVQLYVNQKLQTGPATEESVVETWLQARYAEQMGMVVSNDTINAFLKDLTQDRLGSAKLRAILKQHNYSDYQFFSGLRDELAASELNKMFGVSVEGTTPAQRWEYFVRVNQMASIEAVPVPAANFADRIADPTDEELKTFFDAHKNEYPRPDSPEPGFREPPKIALEFFRADFEKFASSEAVTDEDVQQRYEKNKEIYDQLEKKPETEKPAAEKPSEEKPAAGKPSDEKAATEKSTEEKPAAEKPAEGKPAAEGDKKPSEEKNAEPAKDTKKIEEPAQPKEPQKDKDKPKDSKDTSALGGRSPFVLTAFTQEEPAKDGAKPTAQPSQAAKEEKAAEKTTEPAKTEAKSSEQLPSTANQPEPANKPQPAAEAEKPGEKAQQAPSPEKPAEAKSGLSDALKTRIRREIAEDKIGNAFKALREKMGEYQAEWNKYRAEVLRRQGAQEGAAQSKEAPPVPPRPDFEALAKQYGLSAGQTGLVSDWQLRELPIGMSIVGGRALLSQYAFSTLPPFSPEESMSLMGDRYLFWKTEQKEERVPKFDDEGQRKLVLRSWKLIKAREPALKEAQSLAEEAAKAKKTLKQAVADRPDLSVVAPPPFSWITFGYVPTGSAPNAARLGTVEGVDMAGEDFMKTVFSLEPGQDGAAMNAPETVAYAIQLGELTPSHEVLWRRFEKEDFNKYAPAASADRRKIARAWLQEIKNQAKLEWTAAHKAVETAGQSQPRPESEDDE